MERVYLMPRRHSLFGWRLAAASPSAPRECSALAQTPESEPIPSTAPRQVTEMSLSVASPQLRRNHWNSLAASSGVEPQDEIQRGDGQDFSLSSLPGAQQLDLVRAAQKDDYYCRQLMLLTAGLLKSLSGLLSTSSGVPGSVFSWQSFSGSPEAIFGPTGGYGAAPLQHPDRAIDSQELLAGAFSLSSSTASPGIALPATETLPFSFPQQTREIQRGRAEQSVLVPAGTKPIAQPSQEIRPREGMRHDVQDGQVASVRASGQRRFPKCASSRECSPGHIVAHLRRWAQFISSGLQRDTMCLQKEAVTWRRILRLDYAAGSPLCRLIGGPWAASISRVLLLAARRLHLAIFFWNADHLHMSTRFLSTRFACLTPEVPGRIQQQRQTRPPCRLLAILLAVQAALSLRAVAVFVCRRIRLQRMYELVTGTSSRDMLESMSAGVDRARSEENQAHAVVPTSPAASLANTDEAPVLHSGEYEVNSTTQPRRHPEFRNTNIEETKEKREIEDDGNVSCDEKANGMACLFCQGKCRGPTATACGHIYCWRCITRWILQQQRDQTAAACPVCRAACPPQDLVLLRHYRPSKGLLSTQPHSFRSPF